MGETGLEVRINQASKEDAPAGRIAEVEAKYGKPINQVIIERGKTLETIAKMVGSDFGMNVQFGDPGEGSFFTPEDKTIPEDKWNSIILDPLILSEFDGADEAITAHEGSHRAITRTLDQTGLKPKKESDRLAENLGWSYIHNVLEDPAVNDWVSSVYPRIAQILDRNYDNEFQEENSVMSTPQIQKMVAVLGYVPDFVRYGSEIMRYWHKGSYSKDLPEGVKAALQATQLSARSFYRSIPYAYPTEKDVIAKAKIRWRLYEKEIWPFVQDIIAKDKIDEKLKQYLKDKLGEALKKAGQKGQEDSNGQPQAGQGTSLEDLMDQFGFDEKEKQEMREKIEKALGQKTKQKGELKGKLEKGEITQEEFDQQAQGVDDNLPIDMKSLSDSVKKKIGDTLSDEPKEVQDQAERMAKESLEKAEDIVNEDLKGKLGPNDESHQERRERQTEETEKARKLAEKLAQEAQEKRRQEDEYKKYLKEQESKRSEWEKAVSQHSGQIDELYQNTEEYFQKRRHPRWQKGHPSGQRMTISSAMQYEADPRNYLRLWERKTIPDKMDYRFLFLVDLSGSTVKYPDIRVNEFKGTVVGTEVITALGIPSAVVGYTTGLVENSKDVIRIYKGFEDDLNTDRDRLQPELSKLLDEGRGFTPTIEATRATSAMLRAQSQQIRENAHFLIVMTDGVPTTLSGEEVDLKMLKKENDRLSKENNQVIIGIGIGPEINEEALIEAYGQGRYVYARNQKDFPSKTAALIDTIFTQSQTVANQQ